MQSEVHTDGILRDIFDSGRECFVPRYIGSSMDMVKLDSMEDFLSLPETAWKIKQPAEDEKREDAMKTGMAALPEYMAKMMSISPLEIEIGTSRVEKIDISHFSPCSI